MYIRAILLYLFSLHVHFEAPLDENGGTSRSEQDGCQDILHNKHQHDDLQHTDQLQKSQPFIRSCVEDSPDAVATNASRLNRTFSSLQQQNLWKR